MNPLRVLVACEFSGVVRRAFAARGHDAWSCDLLPSEDGSNRHIRGDARELLRPGLWDLLIVAHPPCTRLCKSGLRWLHKAPPGRTLDQMRAELREGAELFSAFWNAPIDRIAIENPRMHRLAQQLIVNYQPPAQVVQPHEFGHPEFKGIGLWLKGVWPLVPTQPLAPPARDTREWFDWSKTHRMAPSQNRRHERSRFFPGVADAMAEQWGGWAMREAMAA